MNEKLNNKLENLRKYVQEHLITSILMIFVTIYASGIISQGIYSLIYLPKIMNGTMKNSFSLGLPCLYQFCTSIRGAISLLIIIGIEILIYEYGVRPRLEKRRGIEDERNFQVSELGTYGTSHMMNDDEIESILEWKPIEETNGVILGIKDGKVVSLPTDDEFKAKSKRLNWDLHDEINNRLNRHKAVIGASGTMKSRAIARNEIMQAVKRGESIMVTDPKGELYEETAVFCGEYGYDVKVFNLVNLNNSDSWGALREINGNPIYAKIFAHTTIINADENGEAYWNNNSENIFKATSLLVETSDSFPEESKNLGTVYDIISSKTPEELQNLFSMVKSNSVANRAFKMYNACSDQVKGQIVNGLGIMLDVFQDDSVRNITTDCEISLTKPAFEKCAYYVITSDQHKTFDFLATLFYSMFFIKVVEAIDNARAKKIPTLPINLILDEFSNIGQIPDFTKKISTVRSRNINITVIFQNLAQLQNRYPNNQAEEIIGNCDTLIFLGCTDQLTAEFICAKSGIASIEVESENYGYDNQFHTLNQSTEMRKVKSVGQRKVYNPDEVLKIKNTDCLVFLRGQNPLKIEKFDFTLHPMSKEFKEISKDEHIPAWRQKKIDAETEYQNKMIALAKEKEEKEKAKEREKEEIEKEKERDKEDFIKNISSIASNVNNNRAITTKVNNLINEETNVSSPISLTKKEEVQSVNNDKEDLFKGENKISEETTQKSKTEPKKVEQTEISKKVQKSTDKMLDNLEKAIIKQEKPIEEKPIVEKKTELKYNNFMNTLKQTEVMSLEDEEE